MSHIVSSRKTESKKYTGVREFEVYFVTILLHNGGISSSMIYVQVGDLFLVF